MINDKIKSDNISNPILSNDMSIEQTSAISENRYVVIRDGLRVSDKYYINPKEPAAITEKEFWKRVVNRWPDGTKVEIVLFDKKKHRIY